MIQGKATVDRATPPAPGALRPFSFPHFERARLRNGLKVLAARLPGFPLVSLELVNPAGGINDPAGQAGLASLTAGLIDEGTARRNALDVASKVERLGGYLATGIDWDGAYLATGVLAAHWREALDLLAEVATEPIFPESEMARLRSQRLTEILRRGQVPATQADQCLQRVVYEGTPYAWPLIGTRRTVEGIDRGAITSCYRRLYGLSHATMIVVGDFDPDLVLRTLDELLGQPPADPDPPIEPIEIAPRPLPERQIFLLDRPGSAQTELQVGHRGVSRAHPDYSRLAVLNSILGGKFTSRINLNLRERHGFTYGANSRFNGRKGPGPFVVAAAVATPSAGAAAREVLFELERIRSEEVTARELEEAQSYAIGVFPYTLQTIGDLAKRLETLALFDFPDDYFDRHLERIRTVSRPEILTAAQAFLDPEHCALVAVGPADELEPQFEGMGRVVRWSEPE